MTDIPSKKTLKAKLARYMDPKAFEAKKVGKEQAERLRARREIAMKRADAAIRFFLKDDNLAALTHRKAVHQSPTEGNPQ